MGLIQLSSKKILLKQLNQLPLAGPLISAVKNSIQLESAWNEVKTISEVAVLQEEVNAKIITLLVKYQHNTKTKMVQIVRYDDIKNDENLFHLLSFEPGIQTYIQLLDNKIPLLWM